MNAELANLAKEIGRLLSLNSPELESLNYHQVFDVIAHSQRDNTYWNAVQLFAKMVLQIDRGIVEA